MDKIVITGFGVKAPGISNIDQYKYVLEQGICTQEILHGRGNNGSNIVCGVVHEELDTISGQNYKRYPRTARLGIAAAEEAYKMANLQNADFARVAVIMGTSGGGMLDAEKFSNHGNDLKKVPIHYIPVGDPHTLSSGITKHLGINGQAYTISTGCTASLDAILMGKLFLEAGHADICIVGGSDALLGDWITYGFLKTGTIAENVEIEETGVPFSTSHKGFVKSEGSAVVIMERKKDAESRGAKIWGQVSGGASNNEALPILQSDASGRLMTAALKSAIGDSLPTYVNSQALGLVQNDMIEYITHFNLFGSTVPITSIKGMTGHMFGSMGAMQVVSSLVSMEYGFIPPTIKTSGDGFNDLPIVFETKYQNVESVAITNHGVSGNNTCLFMTKQN
ncbi:beta-ketoacyl synthase N-terminal-like domain-containing protein [Neobacillus sp. 179-C4.2 HS]|uniref:Beta-ketoacyl synthase N-terminal-like domain-containing protein n=1 Tax=Neobacillus driksii TaxID=3035913 RepID=A0ABV4YSC5_9BACI|nr:beta-ketoacyl synthase N-terminal-like domain-containing protein [Neobacillus sp. 179.-C4.2 HS]MDP5195605.1 beta-ketoacyl synthase N-terminal-like domain-containing protein [Neobacillus sp. 179.-C4.2 HS]